MTQSKNPMNTRPALATAILLGVIGPEVFIVQPGFVQGMVALLGFSEQAAGAVASVEMFGIAATTILLTFTAHRMSWRTVIRWSLLTVFAANALCVFTSDPTVFTALRFVAGLGAGGLVSLSFACVGLTDNPDRNFGFLIMWVLVYGAIGLWLMPGAYALGGMALVLWFFALFPLLALPFVKHLPVSGEQAVEVDAQAVNLSRPLKGAALFAMLAYFIAQGVVWAYLFLIGLEGGLGEQQVANGLTLSQFAGIAGALLAALLSNRLGRALPLSLGVLVGAGSLGFLTGQFSFVQFALTVGIYNFAWNLTHPYLLAAMASFDRRGRVVVYAVAMQMAGLAIGPGLAAAAIGGGSLKPVVMLGAAFFILSLVLILPPVIAQARAAQRLPATADVGT